MNSSTPRPTRSRYNSPFGPVPSNSAPDSSRINAGNDRPKTFLDKWVEPSLAPPRPSFAEFGIERQGVLTGMAPLGTPPNAKLVKNAAAMDTVGRGTVGKKTTPSVSTSAESTATENTTPEPTANSSQQPLSLERAKESTPLPEATLAPVAEYTSAAESTPSAVSEPTSASAPAIIPVPAESTPVLTPASVAACEPVSISAPVAAYESAPIPALVPVSMSVPLSAPASAPTPPMPASVTTPTLLPAHMHIPAPQTPQQQMSPRRYVPPTSIIQQRMGQGVFALQPPVPSMVRPTPPVAPPAIQHHHRYQPTGDHWLNVEFTDKVVEAAVQEAVDEKRWPTAYALRTLYDEQRKNERMVRLIDAIYSGNADANQIQDFKNVMKHKKQEGKKERTAEYYFCGDGSDPAPQSCSSAVNAPGSAYSTPSGRSGSGARTMSDAQARRSSFAFSSMSASPHKEYEHVSKKHKGNNFPSSNLEMNGNASAENGVKTRTPQKRHSHARQNGTSTSTGRRRSHSMSSSSSLSSVDEQVLDGGEYVGTEGESSRALNESPKDAAGRRASGYGLSGGEEGGGGGGGGGDGAGGGGGAGGSVAAHTPAHHRSTPHASTKNAASAETHARAGARNQPGPITAPTPKGPKTYTFSTVTTPVPALAQLSSSSTTNNHANAINANHHPSSSTITTIADSNSMAPAALLPSAALSSAPYQTTTSIVFKSKKELSKASARPAVDENDSTSRMKREVRKTTEKNTSTAESFERGRDRHQISLPLLPEFESISDGGDSVAATGSKRSLKIRLLNNNSNNTKKSTRQSAVNYDSDSLSSPTALSFVQDIAPGSLSVSRAGTPNAFNRPTRKAKTGTGLRVKTSPMKKKGGGTLAGIPRASGERTSPVGNGTSSNIQDDNDDYCSACGGNGDLVCCDGCARSFHFKCVDPPMSEGALPDSWYCNVCDSKLNPPMLDDEHGSFGSLLAHLHRKNPSAFHLPKDIREYFENVKTGTEGEYEEPTQPKAKNRAGYDEAPDYFRLKDNKGKTILCHLCHGAASAPDRAIIPCTYCGLYWHLDCLENPMAKEPAPGRPFRCPAHVDDLLAVIPGNLGPAHRPRKIKGASVISPAISRGLKNNGDIEIENDPTDDEEELGFYEQREYGHTYKLPELGIKLDFISQVRRKTGGGYAPARHISHKPASFPRKTTQDWNVRSVQERQAALNLAALQMPSSQSGDVTSLIDALMAQAPPAVVAMIAQGDANKLMQGNVSSDRERNTLLAIKAWIESKLAATPTPQPGPGAEQIATPASTSAEKMKDEGEVPVPMAQDDEDVEMLL